MTRNPTGPKSQDACCRQRGSSVGVPGGVKLSVFEDTGVQCG